MKLIKYLLCGLLLSNCYSEEVVLKRLDPESNQKGIPNQLAYSFDGSSYSLVLSDENGVFHPVINNSELLTEVLDRSQYNIELVGNISRISVSNDLVTVLGTGTNDSNYHDGLKISSLNNLMKIYDVDLDVRGLTKEYDSLGNCYLYFNYYFNVEFNLSDIKVYGSYADNSNVLNVSKRDLTIIDKDGEYSLNELRSYINDKAADQSNWSRFPAKSDISLNGNSIKISNTGMQIKSNSDNSLIIGNSELELLEVNSGVSSGFNYLEGLDINTNGLVDLYVPVEYGTDFQLSVSIDFREFNPINFTVDSSIKVVNDKICNVIHTEMNANPNYTAEQSGNYLSRVIRFKLVYPQEDTPPYVKMNTELLKFGSSDLKLIDIVVGDKTYRVLGFEVEE